MSKSLVTTLPPDAELLYTIPCSACAGRGDRGCPCCSSTGREAHWLSADALIGLVADLIDQVVARAAAMTAARQVAAGFPDEDRKPDWDDPACVVELTARGRNTLLMQGTPQCPQHGAKTQGKDGKWRCLACCARSGARGGQISGRSRSGHVVKPVVPIGPPLCPKCLQPKTQGKDGKYRCGWCMSAAIRAGRGKRKDGGHEEAILDPARAAGTATNGTGGGAIAPDGIAATGGRTAPAGTVPADGTTPRVVFADPALAKDRRLKMTIEEAVQSPILTRDGVFVMVWMTFQGHEVLRAKRFAAVDPHDRRAAVVTRDGGVWTARLPEAAAV